jgi:hypothetical protein
MVGNWENAYKQLFRGIKIVEKIIGDNYES